MIKHKSIRNFLLVAAIYFSVVPNVFGDEGMDVITSDGIAVISYSTKPCFRLRLTGKPVAPHTVINKGVRYRTTWISTEKFYSGSLESEQKVLKSHMDFEVQYLRQNGFKSEPFSTKIYNSGNPKTFLWGISLQNSPSEILLMSTLVGKYIVFTTASGDLKGNDVRANITKSINSLEINPANCKLEEIGKIKLNGK
jgi:hypothetical protein